MNSESDLSILFEDEWLIAVDKPAGQMVHPADVPQADDQVTMKILRDQIGQLVYTIHRLDRPTTGVLLFGKDPATAKQLHLALERHEFLKTYYAIVHGEPTSTSWECREALKKKDDSPYKEAHTSFDTLQRIEHSGLNSLEEQRLSLIKATPHTGRYHQIRRHLLFSGIPIVGDYRYAGIDHSNLMGTLLGTGTRMLLQAKKLEITHPVTFEPLLIEAPLDSYLKQCLPDEDVTQYS
ncbi:MAG: pseudouridine synthase [Akkermansiaceae bacterium]